MGLFVSPEALVIQGHLTGLNGVGFIVALALAIALHGLNATSLGRADGAPAGEIQLLTSVWGPFTASMLLLMARPALAVCLATAVLVTSGFVFNEVFLYWFPNFGFAALVLSILLIVNLAGPLTAAAAQVLFTATAVAGLAGIAGIGLISWGQAPQAPVVTVAGTTPHSIGLAVIAFVGYDMLRYTDHNLDPARKKSVVTAGLIAGGILFVLWNGASLLYVAPSRLADTSIPHILAAKAIMGPTGRMVIGVVAIAGACAAVNYLYQSVARMMALMAHHRLLPAVFAQSASRPVLALSGLAAASGLLMAIGFAGSDLLDISIRAGLLLWLGFYALLHLAFFLSGRAKQRQGMPMVTAKPGKRAIFTALALIVIAATLVATDEASGTLLTTLSTILAMAAGLAGLGLLLARGLATRPSLADANLRKGGQQ